MAVEYGSARLGAETEMRRAVPIVILTLTLLGARPAALLCDAWCDGSPGHAQRSHACESGPGSAAERLENAAGSCAPCQPDAWILPAREPRVLLAVAGPAIPMREAQVRRGTPALPPSSSWPPGHDRPLLVLRI